MPGPDEDVSLRHYLERIIADSERRIVASVEANDRLDAERWEGHVRLHADLAAALADYKASANEWRTTLTDLRATYLPRSEYATEHKSLATEFGAKLTAIGVRVDGTEDAIRTAVDRDKTTRDLLANARNLILLGLSIMGGVIALLVFLKPQI